MNDYLKKLRLKLLRESDTIENNPFSIDDIAMFSEDSRNDITAIAYKPAIAYDVIMKYYEGEMAKADPDDSDKMRRNAASFQLSFAMARKDNYLKNKLLGSIVAMINIKQAEKPCNDAWEVKLAAAEPGFGKLAYSMGYQLSPSGMLMPDRHTISYDAVNAWKNVRKKSEGIPLDDINHRSDLFHDEHHTASTKDDCETWSVFQGPEIENQEKSGVFYPGAPRGREKLVDFATADAINRSYAMGDMGYDLNLLQNNHLKLEEELGNLRLDGSVFETMMLSTGIIFFSTKYRKHQS